MRLSQMSGDLTHRLSSMLRILAEIMGFDVTLLYWSEPGGLSLRPLQSNLGQDFVAHSGEFEYGKGLVGHCASSGKCIQVTVGQGQDEGDWSEEFPPYQTSVAVPTWDSRGVLVLLHGTPRMLSEEEMSFLRLVADHFGGLLCREEAEQSLALRLKELEAVNEISKAVGSTLELEELMELTLDTAVKVLGARGGILRVLDEEMQVYKVTSVVGGKRVCRRDEFKTGSDSSCPVVRTGRPHCLTHREEKGVCFSEDLDFKAVSCACVPLVERGKVIGVLSLYDRVLNPEEAGSFSNRDINLLETMAGLIGSAVSKAMHHRRIEALVEQQETVLKELSILYASSSAMMRAIEVDRLLRVMLVAVTLGNGLGFNRAMVFLVNEAEGVLEGRVGVGPSSADEAGRIWADVSRSKWTLAQWLEWALSQEVTSQEMGLVDRVARSIRVPLKDTECLLVRALRAKGPFSLDPRKNLREIELLRPLEIGTQCVVAPIMARGEALGVILVDNLYSGRPISERDLCFLGAFASMAGLAIQNAMFFEELKKAQTEMRSIQQRLLHSEKLVAVGEFAATLAHEIRNPLVSIGGYARLLQKKYKDRYSNIIYQEVERLEGILNRVLEFSRASPGERISVDITTIIEECLRALRPQMDEQRLKVRRQWTAGLPEISCDRDQIKQVFLNLIQNAVEAMGGRGTLTLSTYLSSEEDGLWVVAEVSDTGGGIPLEILPNIFNPFFTTKQKGTGLGLAITRRLVEVHGGRIEIDNRPGTGTTFRVKLPPSP